MALEYPLSLMWPGKSAAIDRRTKGESAAARSGEVLKKDVSLSAILIARGCSICNRSERSELTGFSFSCAAHSKKQFLLSGSRAPCNRWLNFSSVLLQFYYSRNSQRVNDPSEELARSSKQKGKVGAGRGGRTPKGRSPADFELPRQHKQRAYGICDELPEDCASCYAAEGYARLGRKWW